MFSTGVRIFTLLVAATVGFLMLGLGYGHTSVGSVSGGWFFVAAMFEGIAVWSSARLAQSLPLAALSLQEQDVQQAPFEPPKRTSHDGPPQLANLWHCVAPRRLVGFDKSAVSCTLELHTCCSILAVLTSILGISLPWGYTLEGEAVDVWGLPEKSWSELSKNNGPCIQHPDFHSQNCLLVVALAQCMNTLAGASVFFLLVQCVWVGLDMFSIKFHVFVWDSPSFMFWTAITNAVFRFGLLLACVPMLTIVMLGIIPDMYIVPLGQAFLLQTCICDVCAAFSAKALSKSLRKAALRSPNPAAAAETYAPGTTDASAPV